MRTQETDDVTGQIINDFIPCAECKHFEIDALMIFDDNINEYFCTEECRDVWYAKHEPNDEDIERMMENELL